MSTKASSGSEPPPQAYQPREPGQPSTSHPGSGSEPLHAYQPRLRDWPRSILKIGSVIGWTAALAAFVLVGWAFSPRRRPQDAARRARIRRRACRLWGRGVLRALNVRLAMEGSAPPSGALVVSNHLSYLDIPVLAAVLPVVFVSKAEVRRWPFWGLVATIGGTVYIDRSRRQDTVHALDGMRRALNRGDGVAVFPEATSTSGATILPFKPSLLADAAARRSPVHWATIGYRIPAEAGSGGDRPASRRSPDSPTQPGSGRERAATGAPRARDRVCWWGDMTLLPHLVGVCGLRRIHCRVRFGESPVCHSNRKALAVALRRAMLDGFEPVE